MTPKQKAMGLTIYSLDIRMRTGRTQFYLILILLLMHTPAFTQDELGVIHGKDQWLEYTDSKNALYHHFAQQAYQHLDQRKKTIADLNSLADWKERQQWVKRTLHEIVGPFPEKTPLNAKVVRTVDKDAYRVEHIVYESQPKFYVTASLFIPKSLKKRDRAPVVIYCSGHSDEGYRSKVYQRVILNLVLKGFIVFAFDPVGQGERLEYYDPEKGKSQIGGPTSEHSYPGTQAFMSGSSQAQYMIWDGIRAVDYLLTRKEIDPSRIGITGRSGGGTQSAYIAAFDERIQAAAPECYITSFTRLLQSIGPQDAEQNFFHGISKGIDHGDLLMVRAPLPALMITTTRDIFSIQGARETAEEISPIYQAYGQEGNFRMVEDDAPHASTQKNREAMYGFFQHHLNNPGNPKDEEVPLLSETDLRVTLTGQVSTSLGGETIFSMNRSAAQKNLSALERSRGNLAGHLPGVVEKAKKLSGYRDTGETEEPVFAGRIKRNGYSIEKYFIKGEGDYVVPYLLMVPVQGNEKIILYLHPDGKQKEASEGGEMEWFVKKGYTVLAPDLAGIGEMGAGSFTGDAFIGGVSHNIWYSSILIGRSIVGLQSGDVAGLVRVMKNRSPNDQIYAVARKEMTPVLLHAAAFIPAIDRIALLEPLNSYHSLVTNHFYNSSFVTGSVAGSIPAYDLPDLAATLAPRKLLMINPTDGRGDSELTEDIRQDLSFIEKVYGEKDSEGQFTLVTGTSGEFHSFLQEWLK